MLVGIVASRVRDILLEVEVQNKKVEDEGWRKWKHLYHPHTVVIRGNKSICSSSKTKTASAE